MSFRCHTKVIDENLEIVDERIQLAHTPQSLHVLLFQGKRCSKKEEEITSKAIYLPHKLNYGPTPFFSFPKP